MRLIYVLFMLFTSFAFAGFFELSDQKLQEFVSQPAPEWLIEQVEEDVAPFREGITEQDLNDTYRQFSHLIKIKIRNNEVSWESAKDFSKDNRLTRFLDILNESKHIYRFPDCEFLFTVMDCYDYPENLEFVKAPVFTICKQKRNRKAILYPEMRGFLSKMVAVKLIKSAEAGLLWSNKVPIAFWRGRSTGILLRPWDWDSIDRAPLILFSERNPTLVDARFSAVFWSDTETREWLKKNYVVAPSKPTIQVRYKYLLATDGNTFPTSLIWQLAAESTVIKNRSEYIEWFYKGIKEDEHYVSYETDCSDLEEVILDLRENDEKAHRIAKNGMRFADQYLNPECAAFYMYYLLKAYAPLLKHGETP
ncbi:MAG: hypothetical protein KDK44_04600 [Chlamydiia bacterium]|nr:hypothetical protein [Chlamydiia bacterium]